MEVVVLVSLFILVLELEFTLLILFTFMKLLFFVIAGLYTLVLL